MTLFTKATPHVVVDGCIYQMQSHGGIGRIFNEILPRMCNLSDSLRITLLTQGHLKQTVPTHRQIHNNHVCAIPPYMFPKRMWKYVVNPVIYLERTLLHFASKNLIWHSTYYTCPKSWKGPRVVTVHDLILERYADVFKSPYEQHLRALKRQSVIQSHAIICVSHTTADDVQRHYGVKKEKIHVVYNGCSDSFAVLTQYANDVVSKMPFILYVGTRGYCHKNCDTLLQAYSRWSARHDIDLVVVGPPWTKSEQQRLHQLDIALSVRLLSEVDDDQLCMLYNCAHCFVYPSLYEGFGIPLLEAMACGCPIVASRIPSTVEVAGDIPYYFTPESPEDLCLALDACLNEGKHSARVQNGLVHVKRFSWDVTAQKTLDVYKALV